MRPREEIEKDRESRSPVVKDFYITDITTELLLDIRDLLLEKTKPKGKSREEWEKRF